MAYVIKPNQRTEFRGGKNILASEIVQYIHGGATFDGSKFEKGIVEVGTPVARNKNTGKYERFTTKEGYDNFSILNEDHDHDGESDFVSGAVIIEGSVYVRKLGWQAGDNTDEFEKITPNIHYVNHLK